jgi:site-specific recombinase XerD
MLKERKKLSFRFWLLKSKSKKQEYYTIQLSITYNSFRSVPISTSIQVGNFDDFDKEKQTIINDTAKNEQLQAIKKRIEFIHDTLVQKGHVITADKIKNILNGKDVLYPTFLSVANEFINYKLMTQELAKNTEKNIKTRLKNLINFLEDTGKKNLTCEDVRRSILGDLKIWLQKNVKSCKQAYYKKHVQTIKQVLNFAVEREYIKTNPLQGVEIVGGTEEKPLPLNEIDFKKLLEFKTTDKDLRVVRDSFIFMSFTGLAFVDYCNFDVEKHTYISEADGKLWLCKERQKTGIQALMPLPQEAVNILQKYNGKLPYLGTKLSANQLHNRHLKTIAKLLGLNRILCTKHARQTACSNYVKNGVSEIVICNLMGWTSTKQLKHYVQFNEDVVRKGLRLA